MLRSRLFWLSVLLVGLSGCAKKTEVGAAPVAGEKAKAGAMLAYEHLLDINLPNAQIPGRLAAARQACESAKFGACNVLRVEQSEHAADLIVRIAPEGVEPMASLASKGGTVGLRQTTAVDLADAVGDTDRQRDLLLKQSRHLEELAARKDLGVSDLIALAHEQSEVAAQLDAVNVTAANQQRRLDTNKLELRFADSQQDSRASRIGRGFSGVLDQAADGVADALSMLGYGLPFLVLAFPLAMLWRWLWLAFTRRKQREA